jgi:RNA polymerase sigma-32 factor
MRPALRAEQEVRMVRTGLDEYIDSLRGLVPLSVEHERELARAYRAGDRQAGEQLIAACLPFVIRIAVEYRRWGVALEDLVQQGNLGLLRAAEKYDADKHVRLITYAVYWIRAEIRDYLVRSYRIVRLGTTRSERRAMRAYRREAVVDAAELAQKSGMPLARCEKLWPLLAQADTSLDQTFDDARGPVVERLEGDIPTPEEATTLRREHAAAKTAVRGALKRLDKRERRIVHARLLSDEPCTLEELGKELGVSKERVRQLEVRVRDKLREHLSEFAPAA